MVEIKERGLHNWKNLFSKPTLQDWIIFFMLIMVLFIAWAYKHDVTECQDVLINLEKICNNYCAGKIKFGETNYSNYTNINFSSFIVKEEKMHLNAA